MVNLGALGDRVITGRATGSGTLGNMETSIARGRNVSAVGYGNFKTQGHPHFLAIVTILIVFLHR